MMEMGILLAFVLGMIGLYLITWIFLVPMKVVGKLLLNSLIGAVGLLVINVIGVGLGIHIPLNLLTSGIVGLLGVPGVVLCYLLF